MTSEELAEMFNVFVATGDNKKVIRDNAMYRAKVIELEKRVAELERSLKGCVEQIALVSRNATIAESKNGFNWREAEERLRDMHIRGFPQSDIERYEMELLTRKRREDMEKRRVDFRSENWGQI